MRGLLALRRRVLGPSRPFRTLVNTIENGLWHGESGPLAEGFHRTQCLVIMFCLVTPFVLLSFSFSFFYAYGRRGGGKEHWEGGKEKNKLCLWNFCKLTSNHVWFMFGLPFL